MTAGFLLPGDGSSISAHGWLLQRKASWVAAAWAVAAPALIVLTVSDVLAVPVSRLSTHAVAGFAASIAQGQALLVQAGLAAAVAVLGRAGVADCLVTDA